VGVCPTRRSKQIAPSDREDIFFDLVSRIDDVVDMIDAVGQRIVFYKIPKAEHEFVRQYAVLVVCPIVAKIA
jgi:uncharacterized protein Yka (UPF0111/DUF47 family)